MPAGTPPRSGSGCQFDSFVMKGWAMAKKPSDVLKMAKDAGVQIVDFRFVDLFGTSQHSSNSINDVDEGTFSDGVGFDGSSIRGFQAINESDMLLMPDPETAI